MVVLVMVAVEAEVMVEGGRVVEAVAAAVKVLVVVVIASTRTPHVTV